MADTKRKYGVSKQTFCMFSFCHNALKCCSILSKAGWDF